MEGRNQTIPFYFCQYWVHLTALFFIPSLLQLQWKQDLDKGLELISKAIEIDNKCDFAYETMGTIEVQR